LILQPRLGCWWAAIVALSAIVEIPPASDALRKVLFAIGDLGLFIILLTNAVHPRRRLDDQAAVRAEVHRLVAEALA